MRARLARLLGGRISRLPFAPDQFEERLVWMLGGPRSGSTWLLSLLGGHERVMKVNEPAIGGHLAPWFPEGLPGLPEDFDTLGVPLPQELEGSKTYLLAPRFEWAWKPHLRRLLLVRLWAQLEHSEHAGPGANSKVLVIKDPGQEAAEVIMSALPRARLLFLLRDPRDMVLSQLHALDAGGWVASKIGALDRSTMSPTERLRFLRGSAHRWLVRCETTQRAYDQHDPARRIMVRYEDLRREPAEQLSRLLSWMGLETSESQLAEVVDSLAFESLPAELKGPGKFHGKAQLEGWRDGLSSEEQLAIEAVIGDRMEAYGYSPG